MWNDLQTLERLRFWFDLSAAVLGLLVAVLVATNRWPIARRIAYLQSVEKAALVERVRSAEEQAEQARTNIKTLSAEVQVVVSGDWAQPLKIGGTVPLNIRQDAPFLKLRSSSTGQEAEFFATFLRRVNEEGERVRVIFRASVRDGAWPLGQTTRSLVGFSPDRLVIPMIAAEDLFGGEGVISHFEIDLFSNGARIYRFSDQPNAKLTIPQGVWKVADLKIPPIK